MRNTSGRGRTSRMITTAAFQNYYIVSLVPKDQNMFKFMTVFPRHVAYQRKILSEGKVLSQGPIRDEATGKPSARGLFFLNVSSYEEACAIANGDPLVSEGIMEGIVQTWMKELKDYSGKSTPTPDPNAPVDMSKFDEFLS